MLCGSYKLEGGVQVGTCTNRWYDKLQIIVCADGEAGINFERAFFFHSWESGVAVGLTSLSLHSRYGSRWS